MHSPTGSTNPGSQSLLQRGLTILVFEGNVPLAPRILLANRSQPGADNRQILGRQQLLSMEHLNMRQ